MFHQRLLCPLMHLSSDKHHKLILLKNKRAMKLPKKRKLIELFIDFPEAGATFSQIAAVSPAAAHNTRKKKRSRTFSSPPENLSSRRRNRNISVMSFTFHAKRNERQQINQQSRVKVSLQHTWHCGKSLPRKNGDDKWLIRLVSHYPLRVASVSRG